MATMAMNVQSEDFSVMENLFETSTPNVFAPTLLWDSPRSSGLFRRLRMICLNLKSWTSVFLMA